MPRLTELSLLKGVTYKPPLPCAYAISNPWVSTWACRAAGRAARAPGTPAGGAGSPAPRRSCRPDGGRGG